MTRLLHGIIGRQFRQTVDVRFDFGAGPGVGLQILFVVGVEKSALPALRLREQRVNLRQFEQDLLRVLNPVVRLGL